MTALRLLAPIVWTGFIAWLGTEAWDSAHTGRWLSPLFRALFPAAPPEQLEALHWFARKTAHVAEYAVLGGLWRHALAPGPSTVSGWGALALSASTAALDEAHQAWSGLRGGTTADVLLDTAGALIGITVAAEGLPGLVTRLTAALLWVAAAGGTLLVGVNWAAGVPSGWLWWSTPVSWIVLVLWHRRGYL